MLHTSDYKLFEHFFGIDMHGARSWECTYECYNFGCKGLFLGVHELWSSMKTTSSRTLAWNLCYADRISCNDL
jgi:hypothetical protein